MYDHEIRELLLDLLRIHVQLEEHAINCEIAFPDVALELGVASDHVRNAAQVVEDIAAEAEMYAYEDDSFDIDPDNMSEREWEDNQFEPFTF